ncbi:MAG TPA: hypothetical protein VGO43_11950 [Pyrinomonadaceae bacterium]|jgi:hypothetical protein|nr:hypothetical protein [Pyrinomonadaceae bacterium]
MLKRYTFWLTAAVIFQFLTAVIHSISLFIPLSGDSEVEKQMISLVTTLRLDMGAGFHPTFSNLFIALSSCLSFLFFFAALTNGYLLWKHTEASVMRGVMGINILIFGSLFAVVAYFTFLVPIVCVGLVLVNLLAAFIVAPKNEAA